MSGHGAWLEEEGPHLSLQELLQCDTLCQIESVQLYLIACVPLTIHRHNHTHTHLSINKAYFHSSGYFLVVVAFGVGKLCDFLLFLHFVPSFPAGLPTISFKRVAGWAGSSHENTIHKVREKQSRNSHDAAVFKGGLTKEIACGGPSQGQREASEALPPSSHC